MGLLRKGQSYVSEGFQSLQEALISEMRDDRARVRRENAMSAKFETWEASLSEEDRKRKVKCKYLGNFLYFYRPSSL